jgi:hypothetical protein
MSRLRAAVPITLLVLAASVLTLAAANAARHAQHQAANGGSCPLEGGWRPGCAAMQAASLEGGFGLALGLAAAALGFGRIRMRVARWLDAPATGLGAVVRGFGMVLPPLLAVVLAGTGIDTRARLQQYLLLGGAGAVTGAWLGLLTALAISRLGTGRAGSR